MLNVAPNTVPVVEDPYPHIALENALRDYDGLSADFPDESRFSKTIRMHGDLTYPDPEYVKLIEESPAYRALHDWVYSDAFVKAFLELFDDEIELRVKSGELILDPRTLPIQSDSYEGRRMIGSYEGSLDTDAFLFPRMDIGVGKVGYGKVNGGQGVHTDNLTRMASILLYIDQNPTMVGGEHRLYSVEKFKPVLTRVYSPQPNLLIASLQTNWALHDVNPVTEITGVRKAIYMAVSCSTELWNPHNDRRLQRLTVNRYRPGKIEKAVLDAIHFAKRVRNKLTGS